MQQLIKKTLAESLQHKVVMHTTRVVPMCTQENPTTKKMETYVYIQKKQEYTTNPKKSGVLELPGGEVEFPYSKKSDEKYQKDFFLFLDQKISDNEDKERVKKFFAENQNVDFSSILLSENEGDAIVREVLQEWKKWEALREFEEETGHKANNISHNISHLQYLTTEFFLFTRPQDEAGTGMQTTWYVLPVNHERRNDFTLNNNDQIESGKWIPLSEVPAYLQKNKINPNSFPSEFLESKQGIVKKKLFTLLHSDKTRKVINDVFHGFSLQNYIDGNCEESTHNPDGILITIADQISQFKTLNSFLKQKFLSIIFSSVTDHSLNTDEINMFLTNSDFKKGIAAFLYEESLKIKISEPMKRKFLALNNWNEVLSFSVVEDENNEIGFLILLLLGAYRIWKNQYFQVLSQVEPEWKEEINHFKNIDYSKLGEEIFIVPDKSKAKSKRLQDTLAKTTRKPEFLANEKSALPDILQGRIVITAAHSGRLKNDTLAKFYQSLLAIVIEDSRYTNINSDRTPNPSAGKRRELKFMGKFNGLPFELQIMELEDVPDNEERVNSHKIYEYVRNLEMKDRYPWLFDAIPCDTLEKEVSLTLKQNSSDTDFVSITEGAIARILDSAFSIKGEGYRDLRAHMRKRNFSYMQGVNTFQSMMLYIQNLTSHQNFWTPENLQKFLDDPILFYRNIWKEERNRILKETETQTGSKGRKDILAAEKNKFDAMMRKTAEDIIQVFVMQIAGEPKAIHSRLQEFDFSLWKEKNAIENGQEETVAQIYTRIWGAYEQYKNIKKQAKVLATQTFEAIQNLDPFTLGYCTAEISKLALEQNYLKAQYPKLEQNHIDVTAEHETIS